MKKLIALALSLVFVLTLAGCGKTVASGYGDSLRPIDGWETTVSYANWSDDFTLLGLNADKMYISSVQHLPIYKLDTKQDLERFKLSLGDVLSVDQGYDEIPSFNDVTAKYDEAFFDNNTLLVVYVPANSGSLRFGVGNVYCDEESVYVRVKQLNNPEVVTDDMAGWFLTVAIQDSTIRNCKSFDAYLSNTEN